MINKGLVAVVVVLGVATTYQKLQNNTLQAQLKNAQNASAQYRQSAESMNEQISQLQSEIERERGISHNRQVHITEIEYQLDKTRQELAGVIENDQEARDWANDDLPDAVIRLLNH